MDEDLEFLRSIARILMKRMGDTLEAGELPMPLALFKYAGEPVILPVPGAIMDDGRAKDVLFDLFRDMCEEENVAVFGFACEAWRGQTTDKAAALAGLSPEEILKKLQSSGGTEALMRAGIVSRVECVQVVVQTRERVVVAHRNFARAGERFNWLGEPEYAQFPQSRFEGRLKMWGRGPVAGEAGDGRTEG